MRPGTHRRVWYDRPPVNALPLVTGIIRCALSHSSSSCLSPVSPPGRRRRIPRRRPRRRRRRSSRPRGQVGDDQALQRQEPRRLGRLHRPLVGRGRRHRRQEHRRRSRSAPTCSPSRSSPTSGSRSRPSWSTSEMHSGVAFWGDAQPDVRPRTRRRTDQVHLRRAPGDVPVRLGDVRPVRPQRACRWTAAPAKKVGKQHDWNDIEILAQGNRDSRRGQRHRVVDWRDPQPDRIKEGPIGLQLHSNKVPQEVHFKGLVLETFPKEDKLLTVK